MSRGSFYGLYGGGGRFGVSLGRVLGGAKREIDSMGGNSNKYGVINRDIKHRTSGKKCASTCNKNAVEMNNF